MFGNGGNPTDGIPKDLSNIGHLQECGDLFLQPWLWMDDHPRWKEVVRIIPLFFGHGVKGGHLEEVPQPAGPTLVDLNHRFMKSLNSSIWWFFTDCTMGFITIFHHHLAEDFWVTFPFALKMQIQGSSQPLWTTSYQQAIPQKETKTHLNQSQFVLVRAVSFKGCSS